MVDLELVQGADGHTHIWTNAADPGFMRCASCDEVVPVEAFDE
jgi:hypothetical protein